MNRRDLLKSSATLAAAIAGCIPQEKQPVSGTQAIRLSDDCHVEVFFPEECPNKKQFEFLKEIGALTPREESVFLQERTVMHKEHISVPYEMFGIPRTNTWSYRSVE